MGDDHDIRSTGYNGFPRGVDDTQARLSDRETRLVFTVHAEVNAIVNAALHGVSTRNCLLYCNMPPCAPCAGVIINAGISEIVMPSLMTVARWQADLDIALVMFKERGVLVRTPNCKPKKYSEDSNDDRIREVNDTQPSAGCPYCACHSGH